MKILITGAGGMLGIDLAEALADRHELVLMDNKPLLSGVLKDFRVLKVDVTDAKKTYDEVTSIDPELVIHLAAYTDVDGAEADRGLVYSVNSLGTRNIALACQRFDTAMLYISTDYVFDGSKGKPYTEFDNPCPRGVYAESKYQGELCVQRLLNKYYIVRTSGLYGKNGRNFVSAVLKRLKENDEIQVVDDQVTSPTYTKDLAGALKQLIAAQLYGIWHITNSGNCSWFDFAGEIFKKIPGKKNLKAISAKALNRKAGRPGYSVLDNYLWRLQGFTALRNWKDALNEFLGQELK